MPDNKTLRLRWRHLVPALVPLIAACLFVANVSAHRLPNSEGASPVAPLAASVPAATPYLSDMAIDPAQNTPTPTPTHPVLLDVAAGPPVVSPGGALVLTYTLFSPDPQDVSLGAGIRVSACEAFFYDRHNDLTVTVSSGYNVVSRIYSLPNMSNVSYDASWGLWSAGFDTLYGLEVRNGVVSVIGPTATPGVPTLLNMALEPDTAYRGSAIVLTYTLYSPTARQVGLGADVAPEGTNNFVPDPPNDLIRSIIAGTSVVTRPFNLGTRPPGYYSARWGLWDPAFNVGYDLRVRPGTLTIWEVGSGTPALSPTPRATPTGTATHHPCNTPIPPTATFTFTITPTATNTSTYTPTGTPTNTPVNTSSPTPTVERLLVGHVIWQGRQAQPHPLQQLPVTLTLKLGGIEVNYPTVTTDARGHFTVTVSGLPNGAYDWRVKGPKYLANAGTVGLSGLNALNPLTIPIEMRLLATGDCNGDNVIGVSDFGIFKPTFGKSIGMPGYDERADFNGDNGVNIVDFNLLKSNFGNVGAPPL